MGKRFSKKEAAASSNLEDLSLQHHLIDYVTKSFCIRNLVSRKQRRMPIQERYPFNDNHVPQLEMIQAFCERVSEWHAADPKNIAVVHCMAGKGRTGLMVCAFLVHCGMSAEEALQLYAHRRTTNNQGVSIPSQRRYVGYWANVLSFLGGPGNGRPIVKLPQPCSGELRRIRLYDAINVDSVYFAVAELQENPSEMYRPAVEVSRSWRRQLKKGIQKSDSLRYYLSFMQSDNEKSHCVQMDTENAVLYNKTCLDYNFQKPVQVTGDVGVIFYHKMNGGRPFYACFNTAFIKNSVLQLTVEELEKVGGKGRSICGPAFCLELLFGPASVKHSFSTSPSSDFSDDGDSSYYWSGNL